MSNLLDLRRLNPSCMCEDIPHFMGQISELCRRLSLDLSRFEIDHIAMRFNDLNVAKKVHYQWLERGKVISEAMIRGRPIIIFELERPLILENWRTQYLELPYPASGKNYVVQGWEHVEFVIPSQAESPGDFFAGLCQMFPLLKRQLSFHDDIQVKLSSPQGEGERLANPTVAFKWNHVCIKLHPYALKDVIASENQKNSDTELSKHMI